MDKRYIYDEEDAQGITIYRKSQIRNGNQKGIDTNPQATQSQSGLPPLPQPALED